MECNTNQLESMLQMIDPAHGVIIDENIGLLGYFESEDVEEKVLKSMSLLNYEVYDNISVAKLHDKHSMYKRGNFFQVIDTDGCILFDEYVKEIGIIYKDDELYGYMFILKDYKASQSFDTFFDIESYCPAVVLYVDNKLYINKVLDKELMNRFEYREDIKIEHVKRWEYKLEFENINYYSYVINSNNNISVYKTMKMRL